MLGWSWGVLGPVLGCPWPLLGELGAAGGDFESIWGRLGVFLGWIWDRFGWIWGSIWVDLLDFYDFFAGLALMRSNVPQVSQTFFYVTNSLKGDPQKN